MTDGIDEAIRFAQDRGIDKMPYCAEDFQTNVVEELLELVGLDVPKENRLRLDLLFQEFISETLTQGVAIRKYTVIEETTIDAINDIMVFSITEQLKLGYSPNGCLLETTKEINSRRGAIVSGKFEKDLSDEAKADWYKASYAQHKTYKGK